MTTPNTIDAAIAAAEAAAAQAPLPVVAAAASTAVAPAGLGRKITADDVISSGFAVDHFLKITPMGTFTIGDGKKQHDKLSVILDLSQVGYGWGIRYKTGANLVYVRTTDGATTDKGESWEQALATARRVDPAVKPFDSWQLPFVLLDDADPAKRGETLGYTTVWSSFKEFKPVFDKARQAYGNDAVVKLELTAKQLSKNGNTWGEPIFTLLGVVEQGDA